MDQPVISFCAVDFWKLASYFCVYIDNKMGFTLNLDAGDWEITIPFVKDNSFLLELE